MCVSDVVGAVYSLGVSDVQFVPTKRESNIEIGPYRLCIDVTGLLQMSRLPRVANMNQKKPKKIGMKF